MPLLGENTGVITNPKIIQQGMKLVTAPASEPVDLATAKSHERIDLNDDDTLIENQIVVARMMAEEFTRRAFITQTWDLVLNDIPRKINIPRPPLQSIVNVWTRDEDGNETVLDVADYPYRIETVYEPSQLFFIDSAPTADTTFASIRIQFKAGYGDDDTDVPWEIREGILQTFGHMYENRESQNMPQFAKKLLSFYKVWSL